MGRALNKQLIHEPSYWKYIRNPQGQQRETQATQLENRQKAATDVDPEYGKGAHSAEGNGARDCGDTDFHLWAEELTCHSSMVVTDTTQLGSGKGPGAGELTEFTRMRISRSQELRPDQLTGLWGRQSCRLVLWIIRSKAVFLSFVTETGAAQVPSVKRVVGSSTGFLFVFPVGGTRIDTEKGEPGGLEWNQN